MALFLNQLLRSILVFAMLAGQGIGAQAMTHGQTQARAPIGELVATPAKTAGALHCIVKSDCPPASRNGTGGCCDFICGTSCMMFLVTALPAAVFETGAQQMVFGYSSDFSGISADVDPRPPRLAI